MDRKWIVPGVAALIVAAAGLGFGAARLFDEPVSPASEEQAEEAHGEADFVALTPSEAAAAGVLVTSVQRGGGADIILPGRVGLTPDALAAVGSPVSGTVERVHVATGSTVGIGSVIATLRSAEGARVRASVDASAAGARAANAAAARDRRLFEAGVVARQEWEASQAAAEKAQAELGAARAHAQAQGQPSASGLTPLRSPIAGVVTRVDLRVGGFVSQGAPVAEVTDARGAEYVFEAPPAVAASIRTGQTVRVQLPDGQETSASITAVAPSSSSAGAATVRARPLGPPPPSGSIVSARVVTAVGGGSIAVPGEAVQTLNGRSVVFVADPKGFRAAPVVAGRVSAGTTEILQGLQGTERIAGKGAFLLKAELAKGEAEHED